MNKELKASRKKSQWLAYCLEIGWEKSQIDELSAIWDKYKDENGNLKPMPPTPSTVSDQEAAEAWTKLNYDEYDNAHSAGVNGFIAGISHARGNEGALVEKMKEFYNDVQVLLQNADGNFMNHKGSNAKQELIKLSPIISEALATYKQDGWISVEGAQLEQGERYWIAFKDNSVSHAVYWDGRFTNDDRTPLYYQPVSYREFVLPQPPSNQ